MLRALGYFLARISFAARFTGLTMLNLRIDPCQLARRHRRLRLWRLTADGELDDSGFPPYVDVYPYVLDDEELHILDTGDRLALRCPLAAKVSLPGGTIVPVEDPYYLKAARIPGHRARAGAGSPVRRLWLTRR